MSKTTPAATGAPVEPVLPLHDIQGAAVPGFLKPSQTLIGVRFGDSLEEVAEFKKLLRHLAGEIATGAQTLDDRRDHREKKARGALSKKRPVALTGIAFSAPGLLKLTPGASAIPSDAFQTGLAGRSALLGDPTDPAAEGHPSNWIVGAPGEELDALIIVAGDDRKVVDARAQEIRKRVVASGATIAYDEPGNIRTDLRGHEHFGFDDGVSQPGIRGRASDAPDDFITERHIDPAHTPDAWLYGYPGQDLVWPGEFLLGHLATSPDPLIAGPPSPATPNWTRNGAFLVFRRLRQDVGLFWRTMKDMAEALAKTEAFKGIKDERLASLLVGRWPSGAPVNRTPDKDIEALGDSRVANNHFQFDSDTLPVPLTEGEHDDFPQAKADPAGLTCPWAAHIRKVNTRDSGSDMGARDSTYNRRLLRVGVPFGKPLKDKYAQPEDDPDHGNRGLLFLSVQATIEEQFEFLQARWANDPTRPKMPGGHDFIIGQNAAPGENRLRRCVLFGAGFASQQIEVDQEWIIPTGGGYFFLPSISAVRNVIAK